MSCMIPSACVFCLHYHHERNDQCTELPGCDSFAAIPDEIFMGRFDHCEVFPGDNGVRFSLIEAERQDFLELNAVRGELGLLRYSISPESNSVCHHLLSSTPMACQRNEMMTD
jgi:hypothetical protein